jgi:hypothetical protein
MFVVRNLSITANTPKLASVSQDVAITVPVRPSFIGGDTAVSKSNTTANNNFPIQVHQTEFDWISNTNAFQRLKHLITLKDNWDGYGATEFNKQHINKALELFAIIKSYFNSKNLSFSHFSPFIAPCSDGAILFEWRGKKFPDRELEIFVTTKLTEPIEYLKSNQDCEEESSFEDIGFVIPLLEWLMGSN